MGDRLTAASHGIFPDQPVHGTTYKFGGFENGTSPF